MSHYQFQGFPDDDALAAAVAAAWLELVAKASVAGTRQLVALSGGRSASRLFTAVIAQAAARANGLTAPPLDFSPVEFFWADERCVPPDDPESNYRLAREGLFEPLGVAAHQIHRIPGEAGPDLGATAAAATLIRVAQQPAGAIPGLDLALLGLGEDGHVASLFPGDEAAAADQTSVFRPVRDSPKPPPCRVTLGFAPLVAAREVWVLVAGAGKIPALRDACSPSGTSPLARLIQRRPMTRIFATGAAARTLA